MKKSLKLRTAFGYVYLFATPTSAYYIEVYT